MNRHERIVYRFFHGKAAFITVLIGHLLLLLFGLCELLPMQLEVEHYFLIDFAGFLVGIVFSWEIKKTMKDEDIDKFST